MYLQSAFFSFSHSALCSHIHPVIRSLEYPYWHSLCLFLIVIFLYFFIYLQPKLSVASRPVAMTRNDEILEALAASERKLTQLMDELQGRDMDILEKEMRDTQVSQETHMLRSV